MKVDRVEVKGIQLEVKFDTVSVNFTCKDEYTAQVLFDDLSSRAESGENVILKLCVGAKDAKG